MVAGRKNSFVRVGGLVLALLLFTSLFWGVVLWFLVRAQTAFPDFNLTLWFVDYDNMGLFILLVGILVLITSWVTYRWLLQKRFTYTYTRTIG